MRTRLLLVVSDGAAGDPVALLSTSLTEEGFTVIGLPDAEEFQRQLNQVGALSHPGLRAWARARFDTDLLVTAQFHQAVRELGHQDLGYSGIRQAVEGTIRAEVRIELQVIDLHPGSQPIPISGKGVAFALDRIQSIQKAFAQAAIDAAKLLRQRL